MKDIVQLNSVFEKHFSKVKFNRDLAKKLYAFQTQFVSKNEEHMGFFGSHLTGVHQVRFTDREFNMFYDQILDIDPVTLQEDIYECSAINPEFKVSSDVFNLTCMWLIHSFMNSNMVDNKVKTRACLDIALLFNYRCITALLAHYFKYPADPKLAEATYAALSYRFLIKQLGTWQEVMIYRSKDLTDPNGLHYTTLGKFNDDLAIVAMVNDAQGRIRDLLKNIYAVFIKVHESGDKILSTSSSELNMDGDEILKDKLHGLDSYINYIMNVVVDKDSFIKSELIDLIIKQMPTIHESKFRLVLEFVSTKMLEPDHREWTNLIREIMVHSYEYLTENSLILHNRKNIAGMLNGLKGIYTSSRTTDPELLRLRDKGGEMIEPAIKKTSIQAIAAVRTGLFLYINLRAYTRHYYSS